ncbi:uracil-DNA glycosylase [Zavarzinia sp. CC-PAN008]|uniref:uracil-DNA glycosylase n=1 Tax=Zavarzinia sp. CC-PAN008 TaxID=3243332 RepID=UPI003F74688A
MVSDVAAPPAPARDCPLCPRLVGLRDELRVRHPDWHNAPVPSFGPAGARLLILGLAPGLNGANRTGRPFTGDHAGILLYDTLLAHGFARGRYAAEPDDELVLVDARIVNSVRCLPPENKPTTQEIATCRQFLRYELEALAGVRAVVALGRIAHDSLLATRGLKLSAARFAHGARHDLPGGLTLFDSFHCSRYNTNTGRLTPAMFNAVFAAARAYLDAQP